MTLTDKLKPSRFDGISPQMGAIVGCVLGERFTDPAIVELTVTTDGCVLASTTDDPFFNVFLGSYSDLTRNWQSLLAAAGLTDDEHDEISGRFRQVVTVAGAPAVRRAI